MRKQPTSIDVAKRAGVSQATVSFVLNNRADKSISTETRKRVLQAASELRYRSNRLSSGVLRGRSGLVGVVIPPVNEYYFGRLLSGIASAASSSGCQVLLSVSDQSVEGVSELDQVARLMEYRVDGIVCAAYDWDSAGRTQWLDEMLAKRIAVVIVDDRTQAGHVDCIVTDDIAGAQMAVGHLIEQGHRRIAHIAGSEHQSTAQDRLDGYLLALKAAGIDPDPSLIARRRTPTDPAVGAAEALLAASDRPTAIFAAADLLAAPLIGRMARLGLRCPEEIAVVGYSDTDIAESMDITSVAQSPDDIGRRAFSRLMDRIANPDLPPQLITMPVSLVVRGSSAKLSGG